MKNNARTTMTMTAIAALAVAALTIAAPAHAQILTDIVLFRVDGSGNSVFEGWHTRGNDSISNLYLFNGASKINTGNGAGVSIALDLSVPGTYTYTFAAENANANTNTELGINFFFGGLQTPAISALGVNGTGTFVANGNTTNRPDPPFSSVAGANTLFTTLSGRTVTVTDFRYNTNSGLNLVQSYDDTPGGTTDTTGTITLTVAPTVVPEAGTLALLLPALGVLGAVIGKRKR